MRPLPSHTGLVLAAAAAVLTLVVGAGQEPPARGAAPGQEPTGRIEWESDLGAARLRAAREDRPLLLVLRCPP